MFRKGIEYEREGNYYEATRCYKRALKLDAGIEKKIADEEAASRAMDTCKQCVRFFWLGIDKCVIYLTVIDVVK